MEVKEEKEEDDLNPFSLEKTQQIEREKEEAYLMSEVQEEISQDRMSEESQELLLNLRQMRREIELE